MTACNKYDQSSVEKNNDRIYKLAYSKLAICMCLHGTSNNSFYTYIQLTLSSSDFTRLYIKMIFFCLQNVSAA